MIGYKCTILLLIYIMRPAETNQMYHGYHAYEVGPLKDGYEIQQINFLCNLDVDIRKVCMYCKLKFFCNKI